MFSARGKFLRRLHDAFLSKLRNIVGVIRVKIVDNNVVAYAIVRQRKLEKQLFALDLHTSVTRDISSSLEKSGFQLRRWSICSSSYLYREPNLKLKFINSKNWKELNPLVIKSFKEHYKYFLKQVDSFVVSYSFSLLRIFEGYEKPILAINATRYESPYTLDKTEFNNLNKLISDLDKSKLLTVVSNNLGDKDYLEYFTGVKSQYLPSLCNYIPQMRGTNGKWVVISRNIDLAKHVASFGQNMHSQYDLYPNGFSHTEFANNKGVVYIPYNISTMRLFELATAGFPIRIPTDRLLMEWIHLQGVLDELSWVQVLRSSCPTWLRDTPADPEWRNFYEWWLLRADWHNSKYFPNVKFFDHLDELAFEPEFDIDMTIRNEELRNSWSEVTDRFYGHTQKYPNREIESH
jgi:hypothetical protein